MPALATAPGPATGQRERTTCMSDSNNSNGPPPMRAVCFTCGGFEKLSEPRLYVIQATPELTTGMTMAEWRTCPQCNGEGHLPLRRPPV